jgi:hypothetical protein
MGLRAVLMRAVGWGEVAPSTKRRRMVAAARVEATRAQWHAVEHREAMRYYHAQEQMYLQRIERLEQDEREESQAAEEGDAGCGDETLPSPYTIASVDIPLGGAKYSGSLTGPGYVGVAVGEIEGCDRHQDPRYK